MSANGNFTITQPSHTLTYILYVFACDSHDNITCHSFLLFYCIFFADKADGFIHKQAICCIDLPIMNTGKAGFNIVLFLEIAATGNGCNFMKWFVFNSIRTELFDHFINFTHYASPPCSSW